MISTYTSTPRGAIQSDWLNKGFLVQAVHTELEIHPPLGLNTGKAESATANDTSVTKAMNFVMEHIDKSQIKQQKMSSFI